MPYLQPRHVGVGALPRWSKQAFALSSRHLPLWLLATALLGLCASSPLRLPPAAFVLALPLVLSASILASASGVLIAAYADHRLDSRALRQHLRSTLPWRYLALVCWHLRFYLAVIVLVNVIAAVISAQASLGNTTVLDHAAPIVPLHEVLLAFSALAFGLCLAVSDDNPHSHVHRLLAVVFLGLSWQANRALIDQGFFLNQPSLLVISWGFCLTILGVMALGLLLPLGFLPLALAGLLALPFGSSLLYVSFRDIYLGQDQNSPAHAPDAQTAPVPQ